MCDHYKMMRDWTSWYGRVSTIHCTVQREARSEQADDTQQMGLVIFSKHDIQPAWGPCSWKGQVGRKYICSLIQWYSAKTTLNSWRAVCLYPDGDYSWAKIVLFFWAGPWCKSFKRAIVAKKDSLLFFLLSSLWKNWWRGDKMLLKSVVQMLEH